MRQFELLETIKSYDPGADEDLLNRAYIYAMKAHSSQKRASGAPYFSHPLEVAGILAKYRVDSATIVTALLHDTVEDTETTPNDIAKHFGRDVARLVDGVTKLARIEFQSDQVKQAENFRKFLLAMSEDIRVLLVKLADRLHNMRTLRYIESKQKRDQIAVETMEIYAPLAQRIGMEELKEELENLAFSELNPDGLKSVTRRLEFLRSQDENLINRILVKLEDHLRGTKIIAKTEGREKTPYSIWTKMQTSNVGFEQLSDIMAFRIIVDTVEDCYSVLGAVHAAYPVIPGRFKDYISTPKPNGYSSLHTGVIGPENSRIELQIRTHEMHAIAEQGLAAHWNYKQGTGSKEGPQYRWLRELLDILENTSNPEEFLEHTKLEMFKDQVFCFTPRGDLINLPRHATPVDFAYAVHSEVGDRCVGTKINGRMMPLRTELRNGDQVEIITSKAQTPSPSWERFIVSGKAKACIRRFIRNKEHEQYSQLGYSIIRRFFKANGFEITKKGLSNVLQHFSQSSVQHLCAQVGAGHLTAKTILELLYPTTKKTSGTATSTVSKSRVGNNSKKERIPIRGLMPGMGLHFGTCCYPLPGDRIIGIVTSGRGVTIHTIDCDQLQNFEDEPHRWLDVNWESQANETHVGQIQLTVTNEPGTLGDLSMVIARSKGNISNLKITNRQLDFFDMLIDIEVRDLKHLSAIITALKASTSINSVQRARGDKVAKEQVVQKIMFN